MVFENIRIVAIVKTSVLLDMTNFSFYFIVRLNWVLFNGSKIIKFLESKVTYFRNKILFKSKNTVGIVGTC